MKARAAQPAPASNRLLVFLKAPRPGNVKTRLAAAFGPERAARLYRLLAEEVIRCTAPDRGAYTRAFCFAPSDARPEIEAWIPGEALSPQAEGDLGERMARAFEDAFDGGARRVILIGTDAPSVSESLIARAFALLGEADLVLGPASDGGYYLIGLDRPQPRLFAHITWSTPSVLPATLERAAQAGLRVSLLESLPDVDSPEDVQAHWPMLQPALASSPAFRDVLGAVLAKRGVSSS